MKNSRTLKSLLAFTGLSAIITLAPACTKKADQPAQPTEATISGAAAPTTNYQLKIEELKAGTGAEAAAGKRVLVHYTGWLTDGKKFDSSYDHPGQQPLPFTLGHHEVISGWDQGVLGMKVGGKRKLTIPPELAYGATGTPGGPIPPNATLVFEVELMGVN